MQFLIRAYDGEGKLDKRMEVRPRHLEGMKKLSEHIISAGGLPDDEGKMKGSALIMDFESRKELDDYIANEPYVVEKVWEKIEIEPSNEKLNSTCILKMGPRNNVRNKSELAGAEISAFDKGRI
ncbi:MAG: YciI family protein [Lachnospiraceae bacterium]|nr:YciI family protein [Lachnospiraceae bacterium]